jgi:hypothetical protein
MYSIDSGYLVLRPFAQTYTNKSKQKQSLSLAPPYAENALLPEKLLMAKHRLDDMQQ